MLLPPHVRACERAAFTAASTSDAETPAQAPAAAGEETGVAVVAGEAAATISAPVPAAEPLSDAEAAPSLLAVVAPAPLGVSEFDPPSPVEVSDPPPQAIRLAQPINANATAFLKPWV